MLDILFFALIAIFIIIKLLKAFGDKQYNHEEHYKNLEQLKEVLDKAAKRMQQITRNVKIVDSAEPSVVAVVKEINNQFDVFTEEYFKEGVKKLFEKIIHAYANGDLETLSQWLEPKLYSQFEKEINKRQSNKHKLNVTIVKISSVDLIKGHIKDNHYELETKIISEQIMYLSNENDNILQGSKTQIETLEDIWVFKREKNSEEPKWYLLSTK